MTEFTSPVYKVSSSEVGLNTKDLKRWVFLLICHAPLVLAMHKSPLLASFHAYITLSVLVVVAVKKTAPATVLGLGFYVVGSEVLWRMCSARVPWETGKYAIVLLFGMSMLLAPRRRAIWPLFYFLLLLPSAFIVIFDFSLEDAKRLLSFNLSGPLALAVSLRWCIGQPLFKSDLVKVLRTALIPLSGILIITLLSTYTRQVTFTTEANFATSGGFGPNQVSGLLSLGAICCFCLLFIVQTKPPLFVRLMLIGLMGGFLVQSIMTFSRTGIYLAGGFMIGAGLFLLRTPKARTYLVMSVFVLGTIGAFVIFPQLEKYTGGKLSERYAQTDTSGRSDILQEEFGIFLDNLVLGVGPGVAKTIRSGFGGFASHSEPSRLLAEHGSFGLLALILLVWQTSKVVLHSKPLGAQAYAAGAAIWVTGFLLASAMRLVAPCLVLGLAFVKWIETPIVTLPDDD